MTSIKITTLLQRIIPSRPIMKYYLGSNLFHFTWEQVACGFWHKYPNPFSTHVLSEDTVMRSIDNGKLISKRMISKTNKLPKWGERFVPGPKCVVVVEESIIDPETKTLTTYTRNVGYTKIMKVEEKCTYTPSSENKEWTECKREAWITSNVFGFTYALQKFGHERFKKNAVKSFKGFDHVLNKLYNTEKQPEQPGRAEQLKATALKAKALAKDKAGPVVASVTGGGAAN